VEATQVEANFLAKTIMGDFYSNLSTTQYTLLIALLITSVGTTPHTGQPMLAGVPILSQQRVYTSGVHKGMMSYPSTGLGETRWRKIERKYRIHEFLIV
jgi:hypothetical protein